MFFWNFPAFFNDPTNVGNLISCSSVFLKSSLYIWKFSVHILLKLNLKDFEDYIASMWNECSLYSSLSILGFALLLEWKMNFSSPIATAEFSKFAGILSAAL